MQMETQTSHGQLMEQIEDAKYDQNNGNIQHEQPNRIETAIKDSPKKGSSALQRHPLQVYDIGSNSATDQGDAIGDGVSTAHQRKELDPTMNTVMGDVSNGQTNSGRNTKQEEHKINNDDKSGVVQEGRQSNMNSIENMQMSFQINQQYDQLAMTQQREKLPSSQLNRQPIEVNSPANKFRVTIQGSADSEDADQQPKISHTATLSIQGQKNKQSKGTGPILLQQHHSQSNVFVNPRVDRADASIHSNMQSSHQSNNFEIGVTARYYSRPKVKIEASGVAISTNPSDINQDLISGGYRSPKYFRKSKKQTELQTSRVNIENGAQLNVEQEHKLSPDQMSPTLKGAKLNMSKVSSMRAIKGVDGSPRKQLIEFNVQEKQIANHNHPTPKKKTQLYHNRIDVVQEAKQKQKQIDKQMQPLNMVSGKTINIKATPASQFIMERKQQLAQSGPSNARLVHHYSPSSETLHGLPAVESESRVTPELEDPEKIAQGYQQYITNAVMHETKQSKKVGGSPNNSFYTMKSNKKAGGNQTINLGNMSKDLVSVINDQSEIDSSQNQEIKKQKVSTGTVALGHKLSPTATADVKRGSAITFFDESENGDEAGIYEEMNATLDAFKRPSNQDQTQDLAGVGAEAAQEELDRHQSIPSLNLTTRGQKKDVLSPTMLASPDLSDIKQSLAKFHNQHTLRVKASEQQLQEMFPELATQIVDSNQNQMYTSNIPRVDMMIDEKKIGNNLPASGIRIFEEHNSGKGSPQMTRRSFKSLSPSPSQNSNQSKHMQSTQDMFQENKSFSASQQQLGLVQPNLNYQVAPHQSPAQVQQEQAITPRGYRNDAIGSKLNRRVEGSESHGTLPLDLTGSPLASTKKTADLGFSDIKPPQHPPSQLKLSQNEHKRVMQALSPSPVQPDLHIKAEGISSQQDQYSNQGTNKKKLTVQIEQGKQMIKNLGDKSVHLDLTQKISAAERAERKLVERKNTEVLGQPFSMADPQRRVGNQTMQKVNDIQDNLNVTIQKGEGITKPEMERESGLSQVDDLHGSIHGSVYQRKKQNEKAKMQDNGGQIGQSFAQGGDESALEMKDQFPDEQFGDGLKITTTTKYNQFNLTNNMMSLRMMRPSDPKVFPMEAPPPVTTNQRFNVTQFRKQMQMIDTNAKFNMSFLASPHQTPKPQSLDRTAGVTGPGGTYQNVAQSPTTEMRIMINHRQQGNHTSLPGSLGLQKQTIADKIREVKERQQYAGTPNLLHPKDQPVTQSHFSPSVRSRSIDIRTKRNLNPFSVGGQHTMLGIGTSQQYPLISDVAKRFKNISDREAPANHISDKVYAVAQNQSQYNNAYQYVPASELQKAPGHQQSSRALLSQSMNTSQRASKVNLLEQQSRSKYHQRKLSSLERPTQLEIGGEGAPMLSLLPPLKTREISPRFNHTVGKAVKEQLTSMANLRINQEQDPPQEASGGKNRRSRSKKRRGGKSQKQSSKVQYVPNTKIIISQTGDSHLLHKQMEGQNATIISNHPVMIKAVSSQKSLEMAEKRERERRGTELGEVGEESLSNAPEMDRVDSPPQHDPNEYNSVYLLKDDGFGDGPLGALHLSPVDASLNEKLAQMASRVYRDVVVPLDQVKEDDTGAYERRKLNIDGTWKEHRYKNQAAPDGPGFHFLEYASKNFRNPLDLIQANHGMRGPGGGSTTVAQTQALAFDSFEAISTRKRKGGSPLRAKSRTKRGLQAQGYVDEKFSLKVQKKPIQGLQHIKVEQAQGPGGNKLYSIQVKQKSPRVRPAKGLRDSIEAAPARTTTLNETRRWPGGFDEALLTHQTGEKDQDPEARDIRPGALREGAQSLARKLVAQHRDEAQKSQNQTASDLQRLITDEAKQ